MSTRLLGWKRNNIVIVAWGTVAVLLCALLVKFPHLGYVSQLTVAGGILDDANKLRDILVLPIAILLQLILIALYAISASPDCTHWRVPLLIGLGMLAIIMLGHSRFLVVASAFAVAAWIHREFSQENWEHTFGYSFLIVGALTLFEYHMIGLSPYWTFAVLGPVICFVTAPLSRRVLVSLSALATVGIAVGVLLCAPFFWRQIGMTPAPLDVVIAATALIAVIQALRRLRVVFSPERANVFPAPSAFTIALAAALLSLPPDNPLSLPPDDYHFGESLLAYQALATGQDWFVTFFSPHGFSDALGGILAHLARDDSAVGINAGGLFTVQIVTLLVGWRLIATLGPIGGLCLALVLPYDAKTLLTLLNLLLVMQAASLRYSLFAGAFGTILGVGGIFLNAGVGVTASLVGGAAGFLLHIMRGKRYALHFLGGVAAACVLVLFFAWPQVKGQFNFLYVSATSNLTVYGNGSDSAFKYFPIYLFAVGPVLASVLAGRSSIPSGGSYLLRARAWGIIVMPPALLVLLFNSYAMGRLDETAPRVMVACCILLAWLPLWLAQLTKEAEARSGLVPAIICSELLLAMGPIASPLLRGQPLLPPPVLLQSAAIATFLPTLGEGGYDRSHVQRIETLAKTVDALLEPGESFLNLTNRSALYFYLNRPNPVPIASTYNAAPEAFQKAFIAALADGQPPLALVGGDNLDHDGLSLPLRSHAIYDYVVAHYVPFLRDGYTFALRRDLVNRLKRLPSQRQSHLLLPVSDANWSQGIAISETAKHWSFAVEPETAKLLKAGHHLFFSDSVERQVVRIEGMNVLSEPPILLTKDGAVPRFSFTILDQEREPLSEQEIWARAFHRSYLYRIPSAWGRSLGRLSNAAQPSPVLLELDRVVDARSATTQEQTYELTGPDPQLIYRPKEALVPDYNGLLAFSVACGNRKALPKVQVYWRSSDQSFSEEASVVFEASYPVNLVPLDSSPRWNLAKDIAEVRIDIANPDHCKKVLLEKVRFFRRLTRPAKSLALQERLTAVKYQRE